MVSVTEVVAPLPFSAANSATSHESYNLVIGLCKMTTLLSLRRSPFALTSSFKATWHRQAHTSHLTQAARHVNGELVLGSRCLCHNMFLCLLSLALSVLSSSLLQQPASGAMAASSDCRCLSGDPCWPSAPEFVRLGQQVSLAQPLLEPLPPTPSCCVSAFPFDGQFQCIAAFMDRAASGGLWRANQPGAMQAANFEAFIFANRSTSACFRDTSLGVLCTQGGVPVGGVDARNDARIQAAVTFAGAHNLRVVVKGTGHDLSGRSTARGSFIVLMYNIKKQILVSPFMTISPPLAHPRRRPFPTMRSPAFAVQSRPPHSSTALTPGAGVQWQEAYEAANARNRVLVGGLSSGKTVGAAGGRVLGDGHIVLSPKVGLGVNNVVQFTIVSFNGACFVANAYSHRNLFFVLWGGGFLDAYASNTGSELIKATPQLSDAGWGGTNGALDFWLLPRDVIEQQPEHVAQTLYPTLPLTGLTLGLLAGGAVAQVDPGAMGLNPAQCQLAYRVVHTIFATGGGECTTSKI
ncbi:hypothetical protein C8Q80DRAFT_1349266 [Daedaleopsis nitida]|nr:hypothetical protein C8Q80DRAFT_1349266 [Daedaleopsis nitida]